MNIKDLILEAYQEAIEENNVLKTSSQEILGKFPTLKKHLKNLLTSEYDEFISDIKWVAPRPSTFAINLKNGQTFHLKWTGVTFQAEIEGKRYMMNSTRDFQQALLRLNELLKYGPPSPEGEEEFGGEEDLFGGGGANFGGGGEFGGEPSPIPPPPEEGGEVEFEEPGEEPT